MATELWCYSSLKPHRFSSFHHQNFILTQTTKNLCTKWALCAWWQTIQQIKIRAVYCAAGEVYWSAIPYYPDMHIFKWYHLNGIKAAQNKSYGFSYLPRSFCDPFPKNTHKLKNRVLSSFTCVKFRHTAFWPSLTLRQCWKLMEFCP